MYKSDGFHDLLDVFVVAITCVPNENGENEVPNTEQPADNSSNPTMTAALSIGIICVLLLIGIVAAYFTIQYVRKRRHNTERWALIPNSMYVYFCFLPCSSIVVVGNNVSYIIPASARIKSTAEAPYYSSVINLPQGRLLLSTEQPLPKTPLAASSRGNECEVIREHIYDTLGEQQMELEERVENESKAKCRSDQVEETDGQNL